MLEAGADLVVVGRAGVGLDNVDVDAATARGVMVVNAPESNILSAAEQAMALLLAQARNIPQAHAALVDGPLGAVQVGGRRAARQDPRDRRPRAGSARWSPSGPLAFGMRLVAYDPYVSAERARQLGVELHGASTSWSAEADFLTIHLPKNAETVGLIGADLLAKAKPGIRIVNTARGGIVDEAALAEAIAAGRVGGAGLDVFAEEPTTASPLFGLPSVVVTPHLGASTAEAQDKAGVTIAEQVVLALAGDFVPFAVNVAASGVSEPVRPFMGLVEQLGRFFGCLHDRVPDAMRGRGAGPDRGRANRHPHLVRSEGAVRHQHRGPGLLRERPPDGRAAGPAGAGDLRSPARASTSTW